MLRDDAVAVISDGIGFDTTKSALIVRRMKEAQRDLEAGKTLPKFLLQEEQALTVPIAVPGAISSGVALPSGFLRLEDQDTIRFQIAGQGKLFFVKVAASVGLALETVSATSEVVQPGQPKVVAFRKAGMIFIPGADRVYNLLWSYYKAAVVLDVNVENEWLADTRGGSDLLIGETGMRVSKFLRNASAYDLFEQMRNTARASLFGEIVAQETPAFMYLGEDL